MDLSLIVSTRNRARQLAACLTAISKLDFQGMWELVIVDNGSSDETEAVVRNLVASAPFRVRYVFEPLKGLANARNAGIQNSAGTLLAFTDDDCYPRSDFLSSIAVPFRDAAIGYVSGRILLHDPSDYPVTINESLTVIEFPPRCFVPAGAIKGANMAFRRAALVDIGGFDPLFGSGALFPAEDCDAAGRASLKGWRGRYEPAIVVSHHHGRKRDRVNDLMRDYDFGRGAYHTKLLLQTGGLYLGLRGWAGLPRRAIKRPAAIGSELLGGVRYLRARMTSRASTRINHNQNET